jgi:hypothetical protein
MADALSVTSARARKRPMPSCSKIMQSGLALSPQLSGPDLGVRQLQ